MVCIAKIFIKSVIRITLTPDLVERTSNIDFPASVLKVTKQTRMTEIRNKEIKINLRIEHEIT